jgi:L-threonylcarbamoyladenylate synthase
MKYKHYAPKAPLTLVLGLPERVVTWINERVLSDTGVLAATETAGSYAGGVVLAMGARGDDTGIARDLFANLRRFDACAVSKIYAEGVAERGVGRAVMNRLRKAATDVVDLGDGP